MMMNKRLFSTVKESKKYIAGNVIGQWISLAANISMMAAIAQMLQALYEGTVTEMQFVLTAAVAAAAASIRFFSAVVSSKMSYLSSRKVKKTLRRSIYQKLLRLGPSYNEQLNTSEVVQVAVEGVEQLEFPKDNHEGTDDAAKLHHTHGPHRLRRRSIGRDFGSSSVPERKNRFVRMSHDHSAGSRFFPSHETFRLFFPYRHEWNGSL